MKPEEVMLIGNMMAGGDVLVGMMDYEMRKRQRSDNPHNFPRFETNGFVTYSLNQAAHDAKYAKWLKKNSK